MQTPSRLAPKGASREHICIWTQRPKHSRHLDNIKRYIMEKERSETHEADNSLVGELLNDGKGERTEIHETDSETGKTETFEADNTLVGELLNDGKGERTEVTEKKDAA